MDGWDRTDRRLALLHCRVCRWFFFFFFFCFVPCYVRGADIHLHLAYGDVMLRVVVTNYHYLTDKRVPHNFGYYSRCKSRTLRKITGARCGLFLEYTYATFMSRAKIGYIMNAWFSKKKKRSRLWTADHTGATRK
jgi:hypothetical protein